MILIGLTGSLATGKSTVSTLLRQPPHSIPTIDADLLARQVILPGTYGYTQILSKFRPSTPDLLHPLSPSSPLGLGPNAVREINRAALGRRVFGDSEEKKRDRSVLNGIVHPLVRLAMAREILHHFTQGRWAVVLDIPLLYETGLDIFVSVVIMVAVSSRAEQMRRLLARDRGLSVSEAEDRVGSQMGVCEKVGRTGARGGARGKVVMNDGDMGDLEREVGRVIGEVRGEGGGEGVGVVVAWESVWGGGGECAGGVFGVEGEEEVGGGEEGGEGEVVGWGRGRYGSRWIRTMALQKGGRKKERKHLLHLNQHLLPPPLSLDAAKEDYYQKATNAFA